jgi:hypothetical protein
MHAWVETHTMHHKHIVYLCPHSVDLAYRSGKGKGNAAGCG